MNVGLLLLQSDIGHSRFELHEKTGITPAASSSISNKAKFYGLQTVHEDYILSARLGRAVNPLHSVPKAMRPNTSLQPCSCTEPHARAQMDSAPILALDSDHVDNNDRRSSSFLRNCDRRHFSRVYFGVRVFRGYVLYAHLGLISVGLRVITTRSC